MKLLFAATVALSAFLLFLVQPLVGKYLLPWFGGAPGVFSKRFSVEGTDAANNALLLRKLADTPEAGRTARYRCTLCLATPEKILYEVEGTCEGMIGYEPLGENGFGYDPIFQITLGTGTTEEYLGKTIAQAPPEVKASVSHRANAVRQLAEKLKADD